MKKYAVVKAVMGRTSFANISLFDTKKEAEKYAEWYAFEEASKADAHKKFWVNGGSPISQEMIVAEVKFDF